MCVITFKVRYEKESILYKGELTIQSYLFNMIRLGIEKIVILSWCHKFNKRDKFDLFVIIPRYFVEVHIRYLATFQSYYIYIYIFIQNFELYKHRNVIEGTMNCLLMPPLRPKAFEPTIANIYFDQLLLQRQPTLKSSLNLAWTSLLRCVKKLFPWQQKLRRS